MQQSVTKLPPPEVPSTVLLVDDDTEWTRETAAMLSARGLSHVSAADSDTAERLLRGPARFAVMLIDLDLGTDRGLSMVKRFKAEGLIDTSTQLLFVAGRASKDDLLEALRCGALDFLEKPVAPMSLVTMVEYALQVAKVATPTHDPRCAAREECYSELMAIEFLERYSQLRDEVFPQIRDLLSWQLCLEAYRCSLQRRLGSLRTTSLSLGQPYERCTRALARLRKLGLIQTSPDQHDGRRLLFTISDLGRRQIQSLFQEIREAALSLSE